MEWKPGLRVSFSLWTLAFFLVFFLPAIFWTGNELLDLRQHFAERYSRQRAIDIRERTEQYMKGNISSILQLADSPLVSQWMANEQDEQARSMAFASFDLFSNTMENNPGVSAAVKKSLRYYFRNRFQTILSPDNPVDDWFFKSLDRQERFALDIDFDPTLKLTRFWINATVRDQSGNKTLGIISAGIDITVFLKTMLTTGIDGAFIAFFDAQGIITGYRDIRFITRSSINTILDVPEERETLAQAMETLRKHGDTFKELSLDHRGTRYHASLVYIPVIKWYALVFIDTTRVIRLERFIPILATVLVSIFLLFGSMLLYTTLRLIRPIRRVTDVMKRIENGEEDARVPVTHDDETGDLERACNAMANEISAYTSRLEEMVRHKTDELVRKNHELVDSLTYARLIQSGILPKRTHIAKRIPQHCLIWRPQNIVSGDFYWYKEIGESLLIAVVDCAGHGIPGAFMSMTANSILDHIVWYIHDNPAAIILELDRILASSLDNDSGEPFPEEHKGIEIALVMLTPSEQTVTVACTGIPVYLCDSVSVEIVSPSGGAVGLVSRNRSATPVTHTRKMVSGERIFISTDGLFSQTGVDGSLFGRPRFQEILTTSLSMTLEEQRNHILLSFDRFRQSLPQDDDITVFGLEIP
ncbi:MAG TPA: SpoIIE family protein phosphatase [Spirochaetota bacterium]|nr:SpoIIE family protein phosphatase [Spirochaetota bacterium]